ncbi:hypothetical protein SAMN05216353_10590 [Halobacillus alkaliphilus]|uniref:Uncharacterized protein n=1 Tax=Halobacillus alkaliphilus TaxID=396056 RepID=A0A1I2KTB6_9BACI|nr:hypothetical protein [Halobacillus alkaliphilus]SFF68136.1 hypothetical protein SAMN05216353_10590 [Halobacillus alkaliphilus]
MKATDSSHDCDFLYQRLRQQEETIAQLVDIIGATNRRVHELYQRQLGVEHQFIREHRSPFTASS